MVQLQYICKKGTYENVNRLKSTGRQFDILPGENSSITTLASEKIRYFAMVTNTRTINKSDPFPRKQERNNWQGALF